MFNTHEISIMSMMWTLSWRQYQNFKDNSDLIFQKDTKPKRDSWMTELPPDLSKNFGESWYHEHVSPGVNTLYEIDFCANIKSSLVPYEQQRHITGTSYSRTLNIVLERLAERVCCLDSRYSLLNVYFHLIWFKSSLLLIYFRYVLNNLSHRGGGATCTESGKNLSNMWQSRFKICLVQLHSVTEMALKSLFCLLADPGEGPRGPFPLPLLIFRPNWWPKENALLPLSQGLDDPPPRLKVWIRHCCCVNRSPIRYGFGAAVNPSGLV